MPLNALRLYRAKKILTDIAARPVAVSRLSLLRARILQFSALTTRAGSTGHSVVMNATGSGNIGDQALFESFLANVPGEVIAVCEFDNSFVVPPEHAHRVTILALENLIYGWGTGHLRDLWALGRAIRGAESVWITGADIMDGAYNQRLSSNGWMIAIAARLLNTPARILGFSWNSHPDGGILRLARHAGRLGVVSLARDPQSLARLAHDRVEGLEQVADMAFSLGKPQPLPSAFEERFAAWRNPALKLALVNISALVGARENLDDDHRSVVNDLRDAGYQVVVVPHVIRDKNDDLAASDRVLSGREFDDVLRLQELLAPRQIAQLASRADLVFTGRMHLAVLALGQGVPAIVMSTQGKVAGLLELFSIARHSIEPRPGFATLVRPLIEPAALDAFHQGFAEGLQRAEGLSRRNFIGQPQPAAPVSKIAVPGMID